MISRLVFLLFCGNIALNLGNAQKLPRVKRQSLKVQINATGDAVCMRYIRPSPSTKLEGFILGYGSSFFSNQYIPLPSDGKSYITEVDAEPRYLIAVRPAPVPNYKKPCSGKTNTPKPLQLVIGTLTPTSVFLSWGILVNPKHDWTTMNNCANDRFYTVRYREKDKNKKWVLQLCPTTETVVDNLKPNTIYEFGVKDNTDNGVWSKIFNHKVSVPGKNKENGQLQNNYKISRIPTQFIPADSKVQLPYTIIKQVLQNVTHRAQSKIPEKAPLAGPILVHLIVPDFNGTRQKLPSLDISERPEKTPAKNETQEWPAESKTPEVQEITPQSQPAMTELDWGSSKPTAASASEETKSSPAHSESEPESSKLNKTPLAKLPLDTLAHTEREVESSKPLVELPLDTQDKYSVHSISAADTGLLKATSAPHKLPEIPKTKTPHTLQMPTETLASSEMQPVPSAPQPPAPKATPTRLVFSKTQPGLSSPTRSDEIDISDSEPAVTNEPTLESFTPKTSKPLDWPKTPQASSETPFIPFKWKTSATPEGWHVSPATNQPPLKQNTPKTSRITEQLKAAPALPETELVPSTPKPPAHPKIPESKRAEKEPQWEATTLKIYKTPELPRTTQAPSKTKIPVSKPQIPSHLEEPKIVPAVTSKLIPVPTTTKISHTVGHPGATMAVTEADQFPFKSSTAPEPSFTKSVLEPITFSNELPIVAPEVNHRVSSPKTTIGPHALHTKPDMKPVALRTEPPTTELVPLDSINLHIHVFNGPKATLEEKDPVPSRPKTWLSPDVPQTKPDMEAVTFRTEQPKSTMVPKETRRVPARPRTSPSPGLTTTKPSQKGSRRVPPKPKTSPSPKTSQTKPVRKEMQPVPSKSKISSTTDTPQTGPVEIIPFPQGPTTIIIPRVPEKAKATLASTVEQFIPNKSKPTTRPRMLETKPAVHRTTPQPLIIKPTISSERQKATMAPKETRFIPPKPKTSGKPEVPQTKPAPVATDLGSINLHIHVFDGSKDTLASSKPYRGVTATESPHLKTAAPHKVYFTTAKPKMTDKSQTRHVVGKTTPAPGRTRTSGGLTWGRVPIGDKLIDQDATRLLSTSSSTGSNTSVHSSVARKKPDSVATPPDSPRPPLAPAKPTPMRRKPLPPNTVTGKPGGSGNVLMPRASSSSTAKPTGPAAHGKTSSHKKPPTASSSPDYSNRTLFNSQPTSDTDASGKRRFTGEGVLYIKKPEDVPCSITDTLQYFPTEEGDSREVATSPPRKPPTNLTVVTVEGCPTFVVLDWEKPPNETVTEYKVVSTENGNPSGKDKTVITTNQTHSTVENLKPNTSYEFVVIPSNPLGEGPSTESKPFKTESADPRVTEPISMGKDAIWTQIKFNSDSYSECKGKQFVKRTWYKKFVGVQLCNSLRYKIYLSDSLTGKFYDIGDQRGHGEDHCQFVDSYLDGKTGQHVQSDQLPTKDGFFRAMRQEPVKFGKIGAETRTNYVHWYECGATIPGKW
ncbi:target of Nesh-SH3 isoform X7 [Lacerta agilis]|uniref:target of Nesh-SH3 isoform X7 n=1 Tax=Lacerta agilis TaxID=80427 RepID=UPI001419A514|nr:target of Nesh-SH3 isoform X7 [Lacerta agilis]